MPGLGDFVRDFGSNAESAALMSNQSGLERGRMRDIWQSRTLPDLSNRMASRGTYYGGQKNVMMERAREDKDWNMGNISRDLSLQLAGLRRSGILAATGVMV